MIPALWVDGPTLREDEAADAEARQEPAARGKRAGNAKPPSAIG